MSNKVENDGTVTFNLPATTGAEVKFTDSFQALDAAGAPLQNFVSAEPIVMSLYTSKELSPAAPVININGVEMPSGSTVPLGSRITITNPNESTYGAPANGVSCYLKVSTAKGLDAITRDYTIEPDGSLSLILSGTGSEDITFDFAYTVLDPNYLTDTPAPASYTLHTTRNALNQPYIEVDGKRRESGVTLLKGAPVTIYNPNTEVGSDNRRISIVVGQSVEPVTEWSVNGISTDRSTGNASFTVAGTPGTTHTVGLSLFQYSTDWSDYVFPPSSNFTFAVTDTLGTTPVEISGKNYFVKVPDLAGDIEGLKIVRNNYNDGTTKPWAAYDYAVVPTNTFVGGSTSAFYGTYIHGEGYVSSRPVFFRVDGAAPRQPQAPVYSVNGNKVDLAGTQHVRPGDVITVTNPNRYTIGEYGDYFVADMTPEYAFDFDAGSPEGTFSYSIPSNDWTQSAGRMYMDMQYTVRPGCEAAFTDASYSKEFFVEAPLEAVYFTCGEELLSSGMSVYNGSVFSLVNPNSQTIQRASAEFVGSSLQFKDIAAAGTLEGADDFGQQSFVLASAPGASYTLRPRLTLTSDEYFAPDMSDVSFTAIPAPVISSVESGRAYAAEAEIPLYTPIAVDFSYDIAAHPGAQWHIDIKGTAPTAPGTVPADIALAGSQGIAGDDNLRITSFILGPSVSAALAASVGQPVTVQLYVTDADGRLLTNKAEYTFTPVAGSVREPYITVDGVRAESGCEVDNWSTIRIVNPNYITTADGSAATSLRLIGADGADMAFDTYAYGSKVYTDATGSREFTLLASDGSDIRFDMSAAISDNNLYELPLSGDVPAAQPFTITVRNRRLAAPTGSSRISAGKVLYSFADTDEADAIVPGRTLHYAAYTDALAAVSSGTTALAANGSATQVMSQSSGIRSLVAAYTTAEGCDPSEPSYIYWMGQKHTVTEPRLYVHHRPLVEDDILAPGDVITIENPYNFRLGEEIPWHMPVEQTVTIGGDIEPESVDFEPWSGNYHITIPTHLGAAAPARFGAAPANAGAARAFGTSTISFTSTLTPKAEHTNAFAVGEPHTYEFYVSPGMQTGVEEISAEEIDAYAEIYTVSGIRVTGIDNLAPGFYIIVRGDSISKVLIK